MVQKDYNPPKLLKPKIEPSEELWGHTVEGFYDPVIDLAIARFKAISLANGTGTISHCPESVAPYPHPEDVDPFSVELVHEKEDRRFPVVVGESLCLVLYPKPDGLAPYGRGEYPGY